MKTRLGVKGVREGVVTSVGVCNASGSSTGPGEREIQGTGAGALLIPPVPPVSPVSLSLAPSGILQMGRWASSTSSSRSFCFCSSSISRCSPDFSSSSLSVSCREKVRSQEAEVGIPRSHPNGGGDWAVGSGVSGGVLANLDYNSHEALGENVQDSNQGPERFRRLSVEALALVGCWSEYFLPVLPSKDCPFGVPWGPPGTLHTDQCSPLAGSRSVPSSGSCTWPRPACSARASLDGAPPPLG